MHAHISECCVYLPNPKSLIEDISPRISALGVLIVDNGMERVFLFDDGEAVAKAADGRLLMRVAATTVVASHAIRIALEVSIFDASAQVPTKFVWLPV